MTLFMHPGETRSRYILAFDGRFATSATATQAGAEAIGVFFLAAMKVNPDELVVSSELASEVGATPQSIQRLVDSGLWYPVPGGYLMENPETYDLWTYFANDYRKKIRAGVRRRVYDRDGHRCVVCGSEDNLTLDHIVPWSLGGADSVANLQTMCRSCNSRKGARV